MPTIPFTGQTIWLMNTSTLGMCPGLTTTTNSMTQSFYSTTSTSTATYQIEEVWIDEGDLVTHAEYLALAVERGIRFRIRTAEQTALAQEAATAQRILSEHREAEHRAVKERARELLLAHLTPAQRETFEEKKWFIVIGGKTKTHYRIRDAGVAGNIDVLEGNVAFHRLCCHCNMDIPSYDQYLAQKMSLMWDEENFLKTANRC